MVKISISPWGGNFHFSARGESYAISKKSHSGVNFITPTCNIPLSSSFFITVNSSSTNFRCLTK